MLTIFIGGLLIGINMLIPPTFLRYSYIEYLICVLVLLVGISVGSDDKSWKLMKNIRISFLLLPIVSLSGSLLGVFIMSFLLPSLKLKEVMAAGLGMGYYSVSSLIVTRFSGETIGAIALIANIMREVFTLLVSPFLAKYFGNLAPIASGGATSMDTTLAVITKSSGKDYAFIAIFSGVVLSILVPFLVTFIIR